VLLVAATRTQVHLTAAQRAQIEELRRRDGGSLAEIVREALDQYLAHEQIDASRALASTFGACARSTA
jgi:hypothetical protein